MNQGAFWLNNTQPISGDDMIVRNAMHNQARGVSNKIFAALEKYLHGPTPTLNFVTGDSPLVPGGGSSANVAANSVNINPRALMSLVTPTSTYHNWAVQVLPHEFSHLRQTPDVLADDAKREGGAQAFADLTAAAAAKQAGVPYGGGRFDGDYAQYVQNVMDELGKAWVLYQQFGNPSS